jgi:signal transduction histidine kinase
VFSISDNGIGIEKVYQDKVFEKFFRVPTGDIHNVKGFGLGLTYVREIITLHNGTIVLTGEKGKGTIFTISLPYA